MKNNVNILIAHDFSDCSTQALNYGIEFAIENQATLHFLYVDVQYQAPGSPVVSGHPDAVELREKLITSIDNSFAELGFSIEDIPEIKFAVQRHIAAAPAIVTYCSDHKIDLVVLGTHGRRGLTRKLLGSVAEEVVRLAPCTVFTVQEELPFKPLITRLHAVAVPFDFSDHAHKALLFAKEVAATFGATMDVIHVIEEHLHNTFYREGIAGVYDSGVNLEEKVKTALATIVSELPGDPVPVALSVLTGHPVKQTISWLQKQAHNLAVVSTTGHIGLERAMLGSVAERIVRLAPCPVFTFKPIQLPRSNSVARQAPEKNLL
ncbi:MAG: universal stress protein [Bacteroidota bacterium]